MEMKEMVKKLNEASDAYYAGLPEIMSNKEWDDLFDALKKLEAETGIVLPDSPTNRVGGELDEAKGKKEAHEFPALSLDKTKFIDELIKWANGKDLWLSWKLDGLTLVVTYDNGKLTKIVTRGDGIVGTNITRLADGIKGILKNIDYKGHLVIRGEAVISYSDFNQYLEETGADYKNPRNLASGSMTLDDVEELKNRNVTWIPFTPVFLGDKENELTTWGSRMEFLTTLGFKTVDSIFIDMSDTQKLTKAIEEFTKLVENGFDIPVDGLVVCPDDWVYSQSGKLTGHHSTTAGFAFKWQDEEAVSKLIDIEWSCATNAITPVAIFEPVELEGTTVTRASLHNVSEMYHLLGLLPYENQPITIYKANKIIPAIVANNGKKEVWKKINEYPDYEISNLGRVRSFKTKKTKYLHPKVSATGYCDITLCNNNKARTFLLHRLEMMTFSPVPNMDLLEVNHKNEIKICNELENLEWKNSKDNCNYGKRNQKISDAQRTPVKCVETGEIFENMQNAADYVKVNKTCIFRALQDSQNFTCAGYHWKYAEKETYIKSQPRIFYIPDTCPACGAATKINVSDSGTEVLTCTNPNCSAKNLSKLSRFVGKHGMDIDGMSEATLRTLINHGWIKCYTDIYHLKDHEASWKALDGFGEKSVDNLLAAIEKSRKTNFTKFMYAMSIPNIGREQVKLLKNHLDAIYNKVDEWPTLNEDCYDLMGLLAKLVYKNYDFTAIDGFGQVLATSLSDWVEYNLVDCQSYDIVDLLKELKFEDAPPVKASSNVDLTGKTFVITGDVHHYKNREELKAYIESCGGKVAGSVSSKTSYLINNDVNSTSGKNQKAKELGVPIISEEDFISNFS